MRISNTEYMIEKNVIKYKDLTRTMDDEILNTKIKDLPNIIEEWFHGVNVCKKRYEQGYILFDEVYTIKDIEKLMDDMSNLEDCCDIDISEKGIEMFAAKEGLAYKEINGKYLLHKDERILEKILNKIKELHLNIEDILYIIDNDKHIEIHIPEGDDMKIIKL